MFLGHFAVAMAGSRMEPRLRLGTAFVAAQLPDLLWPLLLLAGVERATIVPGDTVVTPLRFEHYPWSHSLLMVALWGGALALALRLRGSGTRAGLMAGGLALSHWLLDFVSHRPDMPLVPWGGLRLGLGLWNSLPLTLLVEGLLFAWGIGYYARGRRAGKRFWALVATLLVLHLANLFGPPPPNMTAVALSAIVLFPLLWLWGNKVGWLSAKAPDRLERRARHAPRLLDHALAAFLGGPEVVGEQHHHVPAAAARVGAKSAATARTVTLMPLIG